eukprot:PhM_4_TR671/c1_g1_i1/m.78891
MDSTTPSPSPDAPRPSHEYTHHPHHYINHLQQQQQRQPQHHVDPTTADVGPYDYISNTDYRRHHHANNNNSNINDDNNNHTGLFLDPTSTTTDASYHHHHHDHDASNYDVDAVLASARDGLNNIRVDFGMPKVPMPSTLGTYRRQHSRNVDGLERSNSTSAGRRARYEDAMTPTGLSRPRGTVDVTRTPRENIWARLHETGMERKAIRMDTSRLREFHELMDVERQKAELTFRPQTTRAPQGQERGEKLTVRELVNLLSRTTRDIKKEQLEKQEREAAECTFQPRIDRHSSRLTGAPSPQRPGAGSAVSDRLYRQAAARRRQLEELQVAALKAEDAKIAHEVETFKRTHSGARGRPGGTNLVVSSTIPRQASVTPKRQTSRPAVGSHCSSNGNVNGTGRSTKTTPQSRGHSNPASIRKM